MYRFVAAFVTTLLGLMWSPLASPAAASALPGFSDILVASGLSKPTAFDFAPDGRLFVAEQRGVVKVFDSITDQTPEVFADLRTEVYHHFDRGLLGLVVDPAFPQRPYVYVEYVVDAPVGGTPPTYGSPNTDSDPCPAEDVCVASLRISRLRADGNAMTSETVLVDGQCEQFAFHDGGGMAIGPDGALYASVGDSAYPLDYGFGGNPPNPCGDPPVPAGQAPTLPGAEGGTLRAQDLRTSDDPAGLSGTLIRIDPDTGAGKAGNASDTSTDLNLRRVIAYGFRNPFRLAIRPGTNEVWVGDVGAGDWEEIDRVPEAGAPVENFGWPCYEGPGRLPGMDALDASICEGLYAEPGAALPPWFTYNHRTKIVPNEACGTGSSAITGINFYKSGGYPSRYEGALFFADVYRKCIWAMLPGPDGLPDPSRVETFISGITTPVDLRTGPGGDLYYVSVATGTLHRIHYDASNQPPNASISADRSAGDAPLNVTFDGAGSSDTDPGDTLTYSWDLNGDGTFDDATSPQAQYTFDTAGTHTARLRVTDAAGATDVASFDVTAGSTPEPVIDTPAAATTWEVGQPISFSGHAGDRDDGELPASALSWKLVLLHCYTSGDCHEHEVSTFDGVAEGSFVAPDHPWPARLELRLTATSSHGVRSTSSVVIDPRTVQLDFTSNPPGMQIAAGSDVGTTPFTTTAIAGSRLTLTAASPQVLDGATYDFKSWDDGGTAQHSLVAESSASYTATFQRHSARPTANAGPDLTVPSAAAFSLDGSRSSDPDGGPLDYAWTQVGGAPVVLSDDRTALAHAAGIKGPATLTFQLTVTDTSGLSHTDIVVVTVKAPK